MNNFKIDKNKVKNMISKITTWEEWDRIEEDIFRISSWEVNTKSIESDLERLPEMIDGYEWEPTTLSYDISPEIYHLHKQSRMEVFAKLEPEAHRENQSHPERYCKLCVYCRRWSRKYPKDKCPNCGNELLPLPLNE